MKKFLIAAALWLASLAPALAQTCPAYSFTFTPNTTIRSAQVNANFQSILTCANNSLAPLASPTFTGTINGASEALTGGLTLGSPLLVTSGGTGLATLTAHNLLIGNGTGAPLFLAPGASGNLALSNGTDWTSGSLTAGNGIAITAGSTVAATFAAKADMQAPTSAVLVVNPAQAQNHPGVAKVWVSYNGVGAAILGNYNVTSVTKNGTGDYTINFTTAFANANFACAGMTNVGFGSVILVSKAVGSVRVNTVNTSGVSTDGNPVDVACFGTQ